MGSPGKLITLPFVVAIFWPKLTFCDHPFALGWLPQLNFVLLVVKCHGVSPLSTAMRAFHSSRRPTQVFACRWRGLRDLEMQDLRGFPSHNPPLSAWGLWEGIFHFSPSRPRDLRGLSWDRGLCLSWSHDLGFGSCRKLYSSKWGVFESWCLAHAIDPVNCPVGPVLEFLQERMTAGAAATPLRVYVAAIAARRELDEIPLGRHRMVSAFMRGVRRLRPVHPTAVPSWDLTVVLEGLVTAPFKPLESASERILTLKVTLLLALTSLKRVGDLQAFSVSETCMDFAPGLVKVTLPPRPGYIPKVLSTSFRSQVVTLHYFHPPPFASSEDEKLHMLCPVRALKLYVDRSKVWRKSSQLLVCFGSRGFLTGWETPFRWLMRRGTSLHLLVFGRVLLGV